jgi:phosphate uptake regulator
VRVLTRCCADAVCKSVQHYQGEDAWVIGAIAGCAPMAEAVEAEARSVLANSQLTMEQINEVASVLKASGDLRAVARSARQVSQLSWLFRQEGSPPEAMELVRRVGEAAQDVALLAAEALDRADPGVARNAALLYRNVDRVRAEAERELLSDLGTHALPPVLRRMTLAAVWFMAISGEGMARVAARAAGPSA